MHGPTQYLCHSSQRYNQIDIIDIRQIIYIVGFIFGMDSKIYYCEGGQVGSLAEIGIPKQFCISGRKMKEISTTLKYLKSSKKIKC